MKLTFAVKFRRYPHPLATAEVLGDLDASAAADTTDQARAKLHDTIHAQLRRIHPRRLARLGRAHPPAGADPRQMTEPIERPALGDPTPHIQTPHIQTPHIQPERVVVESMTVQFEPLDLSKLPADVVHRDIFDDLLANVDTDSNSPTVETPTLAAVAQHWTAADQPEARGIQPAVGRTERIDDVRQLIGADRPAAVVLVGPPRVGKTSLVKHLAWQRRADDGSGDPHGLWFADAAHLTSTTPEFTDWQHQCGRIIAELQQGADILYIGELLDALDAGAQGGRTSTLAQCFKPHLSDRRLRLVAEATPRQWNEIQQRDVGFARTFDVVYVEPVPPRRALQIIRAATDRLGRRRGVALTDSAVERAWRLQQRFATAGDPMGRTIDFVGRTLRRAAQAYRVEIDEPAVVDYFCQESGLPAAMLADERTLDLADVRDTLSGRVLGQPEAVRRIADVVGVTKAGLAPADRPLGSLFFVGPTGVGKTALARALASYLFGDISRGGQPGGAGDQPRIVRLDMSEYGQPDAYGRLLGDADHPGDLTAPVRRQPFSVVLLDEVEKAHPRVFDLLLQVLGEARLTDAEGRTSHFQNTIVIMTSNLGVEPVDAAGGRAERHDQPTAWMDHFRREAERIFRPEFLGRIDQFVPFRPLSDPTIEAIARRQIQALTDRHGLRRRDLNVDFGDDVVRWVAAHTDGGEGARPVKRSVEQNLAWPMARAIAAGELDDDLSYVLNIGVDTTDEPSVVSWELTALDASQSGPTSRGAMLARLEHIGGLRRRLQRCLSSDIFAQLDQRVHHFDTASQAETFWDQPGAADLAQKADKARDLVDAVRLLAGEFESIEDLGRQAYHGRSFELTDAIDERVGQLEPQLDDVGVDVLRSAYQRPDELVLFMPAKNPQDPWRQQLIRWYRRLADRRGWSISLRRAVPRRHRPAPGGVDAAERRTTLWEHARKSSGTVIAVQWVGRGVRPLLQGEDGLHRRIADEDNAHIEAVVLAEGADWPIPSELEGPRPTRPDARRWNYRTGEVTSGKYAGLELDEDDPWTPLWDAVVETAWAITSRKKHRS